MTKADILLVEDEHATAKLVEVILTNAGYSVSGIVASGEEAVGIAIESNPDLILMDIKLKGFLDGIAAYEQIKEVVDIPVIFISAYSDNLMFNRAMGCDPAGYIAKPFKLEELLHKIEWVMNCQKGISMPPKTDAHLFPDPESCRTRHLTSDYWQCLTPNADFCPDRLRIVDKHLCKHPESYEFSEEHKGDEPDDL